MKVYLTKYDLERLSKGCRFRCEDGIFKPSSKISRICDSLLNYKNMFIDYIPVLEIGLVTNIYITPTKKGRRKIK